MKLFTAITERYLGTNFYVRIFLVSIIFSLNYSGSHTCVAHLNLCWLNFLTSIMYLLWTGNAILPLTTVKLIFSLKTLVLNRYFILKKLKIEILWSKLEWILIKKLYTCQYNFRSIFDWNRRRQFYCIFSNDQANRHFL